MAYTQIHAIKATVSKAVEYITNPDKTDEQLLVFSYATAPETAKYDFAHTLSKSRGANPNLAYHLIQSFYPGEVSQEEAHRIGKELADKVLKGKYAYVLTTHVDKDHIHNHIIFCAVDFVDFNKYHDCKKTYYEIRELSDELCLSHELSVITPGQKRGMKYKEWLERGKGSSYKEVLKNDIDACIEKASSYNVFIALMKANGYEVKGETTDGKSLKYISFRPPGVKHFMRGSERTLGAEYTKEAIVDRIAVKSSKEQKRAKLPHTPAEKAILPAEAAVKETTIEEVLKRKPKIPNRTPSSTLIDTQTDKMLSAPGLYNWARTQNLKAVAHIEVNYLISGIHLLDQLIEHALRTMPEDKFKEHYSQMLALQEKLSSGENTSLYPILSELVEFGNAHRYNPPIREFEGKFTIFTKFYERTNFDPLFADEKA